MAVLHKMWLAGLMAGLLVGAGVARSEPVTISPPGGAEQPKSELVQAQELFQKQKFDAALEMLRKAVAGNSDLPPAQLIMFQLYAKANQGNQARAALERAAMEDPKDPEAFVVMAEVALSEGRAAGGELLLGKAADLLGDFKKSAARRKILDARVQAGQAAVAQNRQNWAAAQKSLEAWLQLDPQNVNALQQLARVMFLQKNVNGALTQLNQLATIDKNTLNPYAQMALYFEATSDHENAAKKMAYALAQDNNNVQTHLAAAKWAADCQQLDDAKNYASEALALDKNSLQAKMTLGVISYYLGEYSKAASYFEQVLEMAPANANASDSLALALCEQNDDAENRQALQYAVINVQRAPKQPGAYSTLGWVYYKLGKLNEAAAALQTAIQLGPITRDTAYYSARVMADAGNLPQAKNLLDVALSRPGVFAKQKEANELAAQLTARLK